MCKQFIVLRLHKCSGVSFYQRNDRHLFSLQLTLTHFRCISDITSERKYVSLNLGALALFKVEELLDFFVKVFKNYIIVSINV